MTATASTSVVVPWDGESPIPMQEWSKDHWSLLAFVESACVDRGGKLDNDHMRCNARRHREVLGARIVLMASSLATWEPKYGTRLTGGRQIEEHDDWDCLDDFVAAGLVEIARRCRDPKRRSVTFQVFGGEMVVVRLTPAGLDLAGELRRHKASGGMFATFAPAVVCA